MDKGAVARVDADVVGGMGIEGEEHKVTGLKFPGPDLHSGVELLTDRPRYARGPGRHHVLSEAGAIEARGRGTRHRQSHLDDLPPWFRECRCRHGEVREVGRRLGLPEDIVGRHPFPGPGLAVRIVGEITDERLECLRRADAIVIEEIRNAGLYDTLWQAFAVFLPIQSVGVMGDERTYENVIALRCVTSVDAMTADWSRLPPELLAAASSRITNEVKGVNRVVYDVSSKPPATIEWE